MARLFTERQSMNDQYRKIENAEIQEWQPERPTDGWPGDAIDAEYENRMGRLEAFEMPYDK
jgi:hypothetical protein